MRIHTHVRVCQWLAVATVIVLVAQVVHASEDKPTRYRVVGKVLSIDGRGIAVVAVELLEPATGARLAVTATDVEGRFDIVVDQAQLRARRFPYAPVLVRATSKPHSTRELPGDPYSRDVVLVLPRRKSIHGRVVDSKRIPVPHTTVHVRSEGSSGTPYRRTVAVDEQGYFSIPDAGPDVAKVAAYATGFVDNIRSVPVSGEVALEMERLPLSPVSGTVTDRGTGRPIVGAHVFRRHGEAAVSGKRGEFRVEILRRPPQAGPMSSAPLGENYVTVVADGYRIQKVAVKDGARVKAELDPARPLKGVVLGLKGTELRECEIEVWVIDPVHGLQMPVLPGGPLRVRVSPEGRFAFSAVPGYPLRIFARTPFRVARRVDLQPERRDELALDFRDDRLLAGAVVDERGNPVVGAAVVVCGDTAASQLQIKSVTRATLQPELLRVFTDDRGRFSVHLPGVAGLTVFSVRHAARTASADAGRLGKEPTLVLSDRLPLVGVAVDDRGRPLANADVTFSSRGAAVRSSGRTTTDSEGRFTTETVPVAAYEVRASARGHYDGMRVTWAGDAVSLVCARIQGEARLEVSLEAPLQATVRITLQHTRSPARRYQEEMALGETSVRFKNLVAGTYLVEADTEGYAVWRGSCAVVEPGDSRVRVALVLGPMVSVRAVPGSIIEIVTLKGKRGPARARVNASGVARITGLGPGEYVLMAVKRGSLLLGRRLRVDHVQEVPEVDLRSKAGAQVLLTLRDARGELHANQDVEVTLESVEGMTRTTVVRTDKDGILRLQTLFEGRNTIDLVCDESESSLEIDAKPGGVVVREVALASEDGIVVGEK